MVLQPVSHRASHMFADRWDWRLPGPPSFSGSSQSHSTRSLPVVCPAGWLRAPKNANIKAARPVKTLVQSWPSIPFAGFCCLKMSHWSSPDCWSKPSKSVSTRSMVHGVLFLEASNLHCQGVRKLQVLLISFFPCIKCCNSFVDNKRNCYNLLGFLWMWNMHGPFHAILVYSHNRLTCCY